MAKMAGLGASLFLTKRLFNKNFHLAVPHVNILSSNQILVLLSVINLLVLVDWFFLVRSVDFLPTGI